MKIVLLFLIGIASVGCSVITTELKPVTIAQDCTSDHDEASTACGFPCGLATYGLGCPANKHDGNKHAVKANSLEIFTSASVPPVVGWGDVYDDGTEPCPCWEWVSTFSRGYVRFDLNTLVGPVEKIVSAALLWKTKRLEGGSSKSCVKYLYEATGPWERGKTPAVLLFDNLDTTAIGAGYYGVANQVEKWLANPNGNYGFMFVPSRASTVKKSNSDCTDSLDDLRLVVKYRQKDVKWPNQ